jgi:hypothetical protein
MDFKEREAIQVYMGKAAEKYGQISPILERTTIRYDNLDPRKPSKNLTL